MTIGAVCKALEQEFPDISISKIRYLEDQKLLSPRRTPGGYRLYTPVRRRPAAHDPAPAARRVPAAARDPPGAGGRPRERRRTSRRRAGAARARPRRARRSGRRSAGRCTRSRTCSRRRGAEPPLVAELEDFGVIKGEVRAGAKYYDETEREIIRAVTELARYGVGGRNLRVFRTSADREAALLQQILAPGAALAQSRAPQGGARGAGEPRGGHVAPQAPAARARPAQDRRLSRRAWTCAATSATSRTSRSRGSSSATSRR